MTHRTEIRSPRSALLARAVALTAGAAACIAGLGLSGCTVVLPGQETSAAAPRDTGGRRFSPEQRRAEFPIDHAEYARLGYRLDWVGYPTVTGSQQIRDIAAYDDFVAVVEQGGLVTVLETNTGARRCGDQLGTTLTRFMGLDRFGDRLIVATQSEVFSLQPMTCTLMGRFATDKIVSTPPVVFGNLIIFGTGAGELLAHTMTGGVHGVKVWGFGTGAAIEGEPVIVGNRIGAVSQNGNVTFVDAQSGSLVGRARIWGGLATNPVADEHTMYIASLDQSIYAFAADGGSMLWRYRTPYPLRDQPAFHAGEDGGTLYAAIPGRGLVALDAATGQARWTTADFNGTVVAINRGRLVAFDGQSAALIDPRTGDILERVPLPGVSMLKPDKFEDGRLYVASRSGLVARFNPR
jgi:outer membrane protein assembly factor BamB